MAGGQKRTAGGLPGQRRTDKRQKTAAAAADTRLRSPKAPKAKQQPQQPRLPPPPPPPVAGTAAGAREKAGSSSFTVVPATPEATAVGVPAGRAQEEEEEEEEEGGAKLKTNDTDKKKKKQPQQHGGTAAATTTTLPLEPHASILGALRPKFDVRVLSVISSSRMEKRIRAILAHLATRPPTAAAPAAEATLPDAGLPGVVLLHARAADANKLVSIVEIVKRHIREGHLDAKAAPGDAAGGAPKEKKQKKKKSGSATKGGAASLPATSWFQYNRIYDVRAAANKKPQQVPGDDGDTVDDNGAAADEDDGFEPMVHRFQEALGAQDAATVTTTYMSIVLSRTPLTEVAKIPGVSAQASTDALELEFEQWMART